MEYLITTILPAYNCERYLKKSVESVISQNIFNSVQLIIVDDGSTDGTPEICDFYDKNYANILVVHKTNGGVSEARNIGISLAKGEWISFLDSDDCLKADFYSEMLNNSDEDLICCNIESNVELPFKLSDYLYDGSYDEDHIKDILFPILKIRPLMFQCWNKLFKKKIINQYGITFPVDKKYAEDMTFVYNYIKHIKSFRFIDKGLYYYYINNTSATYLVIKSYDTNRYIHQFLTDFYNDINYLTDDIKMYLNNFFVFNTLDVFFVSSNHLSVHEASEYISDILADEYFLKIFNSSSFVIKEKFYDIIEILINNKRPFLIVLMYRLRFIYQNTFCKLIIKFKRS